MKIIDLSKPIQYNKNDLWFLKVKVKHDAHRKGRWQIRFLGLPFKLFPKEFPDKGTGMSKEATEWLINQGIKVMGK